VTLPPLIPVDDVQQRLREAFPEGADDRGFCTREIAAKTVFVMLYVGAVAGSDRWLRPDQVTRMTDVRAARISDSERDARVAASLKSSTGEIEGRWYADTTREPIRDETLRLGLIPWGAVAERTGLPTPARGIRLLGRRPRPARRADDAPSSRVRSDSRLRHLPDFAGPCGADRLPRVPARAREMPQASVPVRAGVSRPLAGRPVVAGAKIAVARRQHVVPTFDGREQ